MKKLILSLLLAFISTAELAQPASNYSNEPKFTSKVLGFVKFGSTTLDFFEINVEKISNFR